MNRRKAKVARIRELNRRDKEQEDLRLAANWERLKTMTLGLSTARIHGTVTGRVGGKTLNDSNTPKPYSLPVVVKPYRRETLEIKSRISTLEFSKLEQRVADRLTDEMIKREEVAQIEIAKKRKRTGVLYNKGPYMFISDDMDLTTLGKK